MNVLLLLVFLVAGEGVYFEYTQQQQINDGIQLQLTGWQVVVNSLEAENRDLTNTKNDILKNTTALEGGIENSNALITKAQAEINAAKAKTAKPPPAPGQIDPALGTITTTDGQTFHDCQLLKIEADGITFNHADGITKVMFTRLTPETQKKFGYDPQADSALQAAQMRYQEQLRQAGAPNANQTAAQ